MLAALVGLAVGSLRRTSVTVDPLSETVGRYNRPVYCWVQGRVVRAEPWPEGSRCLVRTDGFRFSGGWEKSSCLIRCYLPVVPPPPGSPMEASLRLSRPRPPGNPGQFDAASYLARRGIALTGSCRSRELVSFKPPPSWRVVGRYRRAVEARMEADTGHESGVLLAVLLGERGLLSTRQVEDLSRSGLFHLVALSGLHVGLLLFLLFVAAHALGIHPLLRDIGGIVLLGLYGLLAAPHASLTRALLMAGLYLLVGVLGRPRDGLFVWSLVFAFLLFLNPLALLDTGFQLTFAATLGIVLLWPAIPGWMPSKGLPGLLGRSLWIGLSAQLATLPILITSFHRLSPLGWIATPLACLPLLAIQVLGLPYMAGLAFVPGLHTLLGKGMAFASSAFTLLPRWLGEGSFNTMFITEPAMGWVVLYAAALFCLVRRGRLRKLGWIFIAILLVGGYRFMGAWYPPVSPSMVVLDVGQASCQLVRWKNTTILMDAGTPFSRGASSARSVIEPFLAAAGIRRLDGIVLSHWDSDHSMATPDLITDLPVGFVAFPASDPPRSGLPAMIASVARKRGVKLIPLHDGERLVGPASSLLVLHPAMNRLLSAENDRCLVSRLEIGMYRVLFTGDIEEEAEGQLVERRAPLAAYGLIVPHHGSATSSTTPFIEAVHPGVAFISDGRANRFGFPAASVLSRYRASGVRVYRTDIDGALLLRYLSAKPVVFRMKNGDWLSRFRR